MKHILAGTTPLTRQLALGAHNTVANRALRLPLHSCRDVLPEGYEPVDEGVAFASATGGEVDDGLRIDDPGAPFLFVDADAVRAVDTGTGEGVGWWEVDCDGHGLFVDGNGGGDFSGGGGDFDGQRLVCGGLGGRPSADDGEFGGDDYWGDVFFCPLLHRYA